MFLTSFISSAAKTKRKIQPSARSGVTEFVKIGKLQKVPKSLKANRIHTYFEVGLRNIGNFETLRFHFTE